jgi:hypothetical protein
MMSANADNDNVLISVDDMIDDLYGKVGTPEREEFRREAYAYCMGQVITE